MPTFVEHKYAKAVHDFARVHDLMLNAEAANDFPPRDETFFATDDLVSDIHACWNELEQVPDRVVKLRSGMRGRMGRLPQAKEFVVLRKKAGARLFKRLTDTRNDYHHLRPRGLDGRGVGRTGTPHAWDLILASGPQNVWCLTDARRALKLIAEFNVLYGHPHDLPTFGDPCVECRPDPWQELGDLSVRLDHHWLGYA